MNAQAPREESAACARPSCMEPGQRYPRGVEFFAQGDTLADVFFVETGVVKLTRVDRAGRELIVQILCHGGWLGTSAVIASQPTPVTAVTCSDAVVARMRAEPFRQLVDRDPAVSREIHMTHSRELCANVSWIAQLSSLTSRERLESALCRFADYQLRRTGPDVRVRLPLHQWELAGLIAVTPEHLSRLLKELQQEGIIRRDKGWIVLPDPRRLWPHRDGEAVR